MHPCKVLIIDDDNDDVEILSDALVKNGVTDIHYVNSAVKAIEYLQHIDDENDLPKLIVTDLYLPAKSGIEFISDLRCIEAYKNIPVVLFSSINYDIVVEMNKKIGYADYIKKPTNYNEYLGVARYINQRLAA